MQKIFGDQFLNIEDGFRSGSRIISVSEHYKNPNSYQNMQKRLHVCETLFGDFNAEVMILLQDAADTDTLDVNKKKFPEEPLRHGKNVMTNLKLVKWLSPYFGSDKINIEGTNANNCGVYYANAVWLIKKGSSMRAPIRSNRDVLEVCRPVLYATVQNLPNLKLVLSFGKKAYDSLRLAYKLDLNWIEASKTLETQELSSGIKVAALNHPAASVAERVSLERLQIFLGKN